MSFKHLPQEWRSHPIVLDARLSHHEERITLLESKSENEKKPKLDPVTLRVLILSLCILTATGILKPEALLKILPQVLRIVVGG